MVMHITLELLHDELDFLSRVIFSDKQTLKWMFLFISLEQKKHRSFIPILTQVSNISKHFKSYIGNLQPTHEEVMFWLHAFAGKTITQSQVISNQSKGFVAKHTF